MKWFSLCAFLLMASGAMAQEFGKWAITPRVGMNVSNLVGHNAPGKDSKLGFTGGLVSGSAFIPCNILPKFVPLHHNFKIKRL